jgi:hypothetical protein
MTIGGIVFMTLSWGVIIGLGLWCVIKIFQNPKAEINKRDLVG